VVDDAGRRRPLDGGVFAPALTCALAFLFYSTAGLLAHRALQTNAFDLSVFDYALWSTASGGRVAFVPLFGHSLLAQHFMPTLLLLAPLARLFDSPTYLIVVQSLWHAVAGLLLFLFAAKYAPRHFAWALLAAFLFSRRSVGAAASYFYIESAEPMLVFGALLAWGSGRRLWYWVCLFLALGCKEDMAVYTGAFGVLLAIRGERRLGSVTLAVSVAWLACATLVAIPHARAAYGLTAANPFVEGRYGAASDAGGLASVMLGRVLSAGSIARLFTLASATGFLCLLSPAWCLVALPGIALNLAAMPGTNQSGLGGHYAWPVLPWLFVAAVFGSRRLAAHKFRWLALLAAIAALADSPVPRTLWGMRFTDRDAGIVRAQLADVPARGTIVALPNLIPHLPRSMDVHGFGVYTTDQPPADWILMTTVGGLWPLDRASVMREVERLNVDPRFERVTDGPLFAFRRR
jgi:uncharacterized membrane protein